ncbi:UDP-2,3-diacylglucosamine hydrolase [Sulfurivirga caldicuralii]|uniref:UDP-2,3-diacylglucosamine hydrolase n=1 Tax=Sulfurivirga caldicuralii TaxID=364032 RepID=A0A1N6F4J2_9GAMM|nr:UDP-2,3-diacylglucosamine diphosphatase [Sulfurivirga caldicuralii]SIN90202.1 UDP-2,3-diacylglucosamine hydrolase [Sulfurivirga caldicuralii]
MSDNACPPLVGGGPRLFTRTDFSPAEKPGENAPFSYVIADIHLETDVSHPINRHFLHFLAHEAPEADTLYILGDLFERWLGDDIGLEDYAPIINALRALTDSGTAVKLLYGNRDFLMREAFWDATGVQPMPEVVLTDIHGHCVILCHGDELCTLDTEYQAVRRRLRSAWLQWLFLHMSRARRRAVGERMRLRSQQESAHKPDAWMDVDEDTVRSWFDAYADYPHLIHGHTHRPGHHLYPNGRHRWVLGDWRPQAWVLRIDPSTIAFHCLTPDEQPA